MATPLCTPVGLLRFFDLWEPGKTTGKYGVTLVLRPELLKGDEHARFQALVAAANEAAKTHGVEGVKDLPPKNNPFKKKTEDDQYYQAGDVVISPQSKFEVPVTGTNGPIAADDVYRGCYVRAMVTVKPYVHPTGGKGVTFYLSVVQKIQDGERLADFDPTAAFDGQAYDTSHLPPAPVAAAPPVTPGAPAGAPY
jgi:hypothetical protein